MSKSHLFSLAFLVFTNSCQSVTPEAVKASSASENVAVAAPEKPTPEVKAGIYRIGEWMPKLAGKRIALVANHTSMIEGKHLLDTLLSLKAQVKKVFAPEHGFRGDQPDGAKISSTVDPISGIPIISLYGANKKPSKDALADIDLIIFDIQDVGARFFTYLSTLHYVMEAAAENGTAVWVLDRPNPNGFYVDGPVMKSAFTSFVGLHPVPIVYGMSIGEYAQMIKGEAWIAKAEALDLKVIPCMDYTRASQVRLQNNPSPNLSTPEAILLYPHICLFEGSVVSVGRGTSRPFTLLGAPGNLGGDTTFTPIVKPGASSSPPQLNKPCRGYDLLPTVDLANPRQELDFSWLIRMYRESPDRSKFFLSSGFFDKLAGTDQLRKDIISGKTEAEIRASWRADLDDFKLVRAKYLIYP